MTTSVKVLPRVDQNLRNRANLGFETRQPINFLRAQQVESLLPSQRQYRPFHVAFPVHDIAQARAFYGGLLACPEGRSAPDWVDFDLFGHQIVAHLAPQACSLAQTNGVDGDQVPVRHFGVVLDMAAWQALADRLCNAGQRFIVEPHIRFQGQVGEQATMFFLDPSGNALEFKAFADIDQLFAR